MMEKILCSKCGTRMKCMDGSDMEVSSDGEILDLEIDPSSYLCPKCHNLFHLPQEYQVIYVEDIRWGINRKTGKFSEKSVGIFYIPLLENMALSVGVQQIHITVLKVKEDAVTLKITPRNKNVEPIIFEISTCEREYTYRPMSFDGGHYYKFNYKVSDFHD